MPNWKQVLEEIVQAQNAHNANAANYLDQAANVIDSIRQNYLLKLSNFTERNTIAYYSAFAQKGGVVGSEVNDDDVNGFMMAIHGLDRTKGLDLIIHTQGGSIGAAESLLTYLRSMFGNDIRALVPGISMSAGTMISLCCRQIVLAKHSNLGPIDPHIGGLPALGILAEFETARKEIKKDAGNAFLWQPILSNYRPSLIEQCKKAVEWTEEFVARELVNCMFAGEKDAEQKADAVVKSFSDIKKTKCTNATYMLMNVRNLDCQLSIWNLIKLFKTYC